MIRSRPNDAEVGDRVQEPLRVDRDVVGDLADRVFGPSLARKFQRFLENRRDQSVANGDGESIQLKFIGKMLVEYFFYLNLKSGEEIIPLLSNFD